MRGLVVVDLHTLVEPGFARAVVQAFHEATAPERPLSVLGPEDPIPRDAGGLIITGSPLMLGQDTPWAEALGHRAEDAARSGVPVLGVCFGHQLLARHFGGSLERWDQTREALARVHFREVGPFAGLGAPELVHTHRDRVVDGGKLDVVAEGGLGGIQALAHPKIPVWSLQAHPEARASMLPHMPPEHRANWASYDADRMDTPGGKRLLANFGELMV